MDPNIINDYHQFQQIMASCNDTATVYLSQLWKLVYNTDQQTRYSKPMPWIGMYIALASLYCVIAMVADLLHAGRYTNSCFPCKYFTVNAASLTLIGVAIKLPMDLTNLMPGYVDQAAKLGSLAFMCTMMANLLPSVATMDSKELYTNMISLAVLVITLVIDVYIQAYTGIFSYHVIDDAEFYKNFRRTKLEPLRAYVRNQRTTAITYVVFLHILLMIYASSSLAILKSKQIVESKYQVAHETDSKDQELQQPVRLLPVEKLKQHVHNRLIMARTGSPQSLIIFSVTTYVSGMICLCSSILHIHTVFHIKSALDYNSDYKSSVFVILIIQLIGVIVGTIAPFYRCFARRGCRILSIWNHYRKVFTVESFWTQNLSDWKQSSTPFQSSSHKYKIAIHRLKILILDICILFQKIIVVSCKMILLLILVLPMCVRTIIFFFLRRSKARCSSSGTASGQNPKQRGEKEDLYRYVLKLHDDWEFNGLKFIKWSMRIIIRNAKKQHPNNNLMKLLAISASFEGVEIFDSHQVRPLLSEEYLNCWSLALVTLTTIAMCLPDIPKNMVDCLLTSGVNEGLRYVSLVEENLNAVDDHLSIQKAAQSLWVEVDIYHKWLGNKLQNSDPQVNTAGQILQWLSDTAKNILMDVEGTSIGVPYYNSAHRSISANSMYRITKTILLSYHSNIDELSQEELFVQLSLMIADILSACLTNLPQVIVMKCHTDAIEKREASVQVAAQLVGETTQIINALQQRELPSLDPDELAFIDKWRSYSMDPFP